jgi:hypothetical protein
MGIIVDHPRSFAAYGTLLPPDEGTPGGGCVCVWERVCVALSADACCLKESPESQRFLSYFLFLSLSRARVLFPFHVAPPHHFPLLSPFWHCWIPLVFPWFIWGPGNVRAGWLGLRKVLNLSTRHVLPLSGVSFGRWKGFQKGFPDSAGLFVTQPLFLFFFYLFPFCRLFPLRSTVCVCGNERKRE